MKIDIIIASILDSFKAANPKIWAAIVLLLLLAETAVSSGQLDILGAPEGVSTVLNYLVLAASILLGARTTRYVNRPQE
jgi:hypothetical protein